MKKIDFLTRYKQALVSQFKTEHYVLDKKELTRYISNMKNNEMIVLSVDGIKTEISHSMFIVKQGGEYHFYDPNAGLSRFDVAPIYTPDSIASRVMSYGSELSDYGLSGMKSYAFESLRLPEVKGYILESSIVFETEELERMGAIVKEGGGIRPIEQDKILSIVAAYFNTEYKPAKLIGSSGVCYGLSLIFRELVVQTGSVQKAQDIFYFSMHRLEQSAKELGITSDTRKLSKEMLIRLEGNKLILSMIPFFHSMQTVELKDTSLKNKWVGLTEAVETVEIQGSKRFALPLSVVMHTPSARGRLLSPSNPLHVYTVLTDKNLTDQEMREMYDSVQVDNRFVDKPEWLLERVKSNSSCLNVASKRFINDRHFMLQAIKNNPNSVFFLLESMKNDKAYIREVMKYSAYTVLVMNPLFKQDKAFILELVKYYPEALLKLPESYLEDKVFLSKVDELCADRGLMLEALQRSYRAWDYIDPEFKEDISFVLEAFEVQPCILGELKSWFSKEARMLDLIERKHEAILSANIVLKEDNGFMLKAIARNPLVLAYAEPKFLADKQCMLDAIQVAPQAYKFAFKELQSSRAFLLEAVQINIQVLEHVDSDWTHNRLFMIQATLLDERVLDYVPHFKDDVLFNKGLDASKKLEYLKLSISGLWGETLETRDPEIVETVSDEIDEGFIEKSKLDVEGAGPAPEEDSRANKWALGKSK